MGLSEAKELARAAIKAETKAELAERVAIRKRKELSAYLSAYKRAAEKRRRIKRLREIEAKKVLKPKWQRDMEKLIEKHREEEGWTDEEIMEVYGGSEWVEGD